MSELYNVAVGFLKSYFKVFFIEENFTVKKTTFPIRKQLFPVHQLHIYEKVEQHAHHLH